MRYSLWLLLLLLIVFRFLTTRPLYKDGDTVRITSKLTLEPIKYSKSQRVNLSGLRFYLPRYPEVNYGDILVVQGKVVKKREGFLFIGSGELDKAELVEVSQSKGLLYSLRKRLIDFYQSALPEPHSSLIAGVTLGSKASIPNNFWEALKKTGTLHVVVASGMNVTLVAGFLLNTLILMIPRKKAVILTLIGIWLYALVAGFDAPIVRAAIMGSIGFIGQGLGRVYEAWRGLFLSALGMLLVKPEWVVDLGFILSFVATASLMLFNKRVEKRMLWIPSKGVREGFSTSLSAQIGVAPILFVTFGQFNILSPVINALVLWIIAPITMIGMIAGVVSIISIHLGRVVLWLSYPLTLWFVRVVEVFS